MTLIDVVLLTVLLSGNSQYPETVYNHTFSTIAACEATRTTVFKNSNSICTATKEIVVVPNIQQNSYIPH